MPIPSSPLPSSASGCDRSFGPFEKGVLAFVLVMAAIRLAVLVQAPLSSDEAYYWQWTRPLALSYYDHPPMVGYLIWVSVHLFGDSWLGVRFPAWLASLAVTALIWDGARLLFRSQRAGASAALAINATVLFQSAGVIMTPDVPLIFSWTLALWAVIRLCRENRARWLYVGGLALGLGGLGKYTMVLILPGLVATFLLFGQLRGWLKNRHAWGAVATAAVFTLPVVLWNAQNHWASFAKQFSHAFADGDGGQDAGSLAEFVGGQFGVVTPLLLPFCLFAMAWALVAGWRESKPCLFLLGATSLPAFIFFVVHAASNNVQIHWSGPVYIGAAMALGGLAASWRERGPKRLFLAATLVGTVFALLVLGQAATAMLPIPARLDALKRLGGWQELARAVEEERTRHPGAFLYAIQHGPTGPVSFYLPDHQVVFLQGPIRPSYYSAAQVAALKGRDAILLHRARKTLPAQPWCQDLTLLQRVDMPWGRIVADSYELYLCRNYQGGAFTMGDGLFGAKDLP